MSTRKTIIKLLQKLEDNKEIDQYIVDPKTTKLDALGPGHPWFNEPYIYIQENLEEGKVLSYSLMALLAEIETILSDYIFEGDPRPDFERIHILDQLGYQIVPQDTTTLAWIRPAVRLKKALYVFR